MMPGRIRLRLDSRHWSGIAIGALALAVIFTPAPALSTAPTDRHFRIEAGSFQYTPSDIQVDPGDRVTIELASTDVVHGLYLDAYALNVMADPGQPAQLTFVADRTGTYRFRCSVTCGALHPFMIGRLQVGANDLLWRAIGLAFLAIVAVFLTAKAPRRDL
jgi:heme/copper-type cytochrome/quinol oxidase subunit 2